MGDLVYGGIKKELDKNELIELTKALISIESHPGCETLEENISKYICNYLKENGIGANLQRVEEHRYNVIAKIEGKNRDKALLLTGHMDTVESYGFKELFTPVVKNNKIYGRGSSDMKGPIASMMMAAVLIKRLDIKPAGDVILAFVVDEEFKSIGTEALIKNGIKADAAILGEPSSMNISIGNRGLEWIDIEVMGKGTHGGTPEEGINAITKAAKLINKIDSELVPQISKRRHDVLGPSLMNIGVIRGGHQPSTVPDNCLIKIDRRWLPEEGVEMVYNEYQSIIDELSEEDKDFKARIYRDDSNMNEMEHGPVYIDREHILVKKLENYIKQVTGEKPEVNAFPGWTDASLISNFGGIPTVIFAPGDISCAHSERECIDIDDLYNAVLIYGLMAINYGNGGI